MGVVSWMMADASASVSNIPFLLLEAKGETVLFFNLTREGKNNKKKEK